MDFSDIQHHGHRLVELFANRDAMLEDMRKMFHMEWQDQPSGDWIKETMSPTAFNRAIGAVRLMTSTEPQFSVPYDEGDATAKESSERIEAASKAMWNGAGRVALRPIHYDVVLSGLLFGEVCGAVSKTADLLALAGKTDDKGNIARMEAVAQETPYLFRTYNPSTCYPDFDSYGLRGMLRRSEVTWGEVMDTWGQLAENIGGAAAATWDRTKKVKLNDWYDWQDRAVWIDENDNPLFHEAHGLSFLPVIAQITEGTFLFDKPENQRFPLLYSVWKSGLWKRENLSLTVIYSLINAIGSNPLLVRETSEPGSPLKVERSIPGGYVDISKGDKLGPLMEKVVDPSQWQGLEKAMQLNEESTIPSMALGAPPQSTLAFSAISLLSQSGRLPLMGAKQLGGQAISNMMIAALKWMRQDGTTTMLYRRGSSITLDPREFPERIVIECDLEPDLPTDKLQMANTANAIVQNKLASYRWARENILQIGQSDAMDKEIYFEEMVRFNVQQALAAKAAQAQMELQQKAAQLQAQQQQAQQAQTRPTETESVTPPGGVQPGQPLAGPLPPRGQPA